MADLQALQAMMESMESQIRQKVIGEIHAFVNDYHFHYGERDVVIVDQLLDFLKKPS